MRKTKRVLATVLASLILFNAVAVFAETDTNSEQMNDEVSVFDGYLGTPYPVEDGNIYIDDNEVVGADESVTKAVIPEGITTIGREAFCNCNNLTYVKLSDSITEIDQRAFAECDQLFKVDISALSSLEKIEEDAFRNCGIRSIYIPPKVKSIEDDFTNNVLQEIVVDSENPIYGSINGALYDKTENTLLICPSTKTGVFYIPDNIKTIGEYAFDNCQISGLGFGKDIEKIERYAFHKCNNLEKVVIPEGLKYILDGAFKECSNLSYISIPSTVMSSLYLYGNEDSLNNAFDSCLKLKEIEVSPNNRDYTSIDGVLYSKDVTKLIECPNGKAGAITIPQSVKKHMLANDYIPLLTDVYVEAGNNYYNSVDGVLYKDNSLEFCPAGKIGSVEIPEGIEVINEYAFAYSNISNVKLPSSLLTIKNFAFFNCDNIKIISIPERVNFLSTGAFTECFNLKLIRFYGDAPEISEKLEINGTKVVAISIRNKKNNKFSTTVMIPEVFKICAEDFEINYLNGKSGWTTPEWKGYPCYPVDAYEAEPETKATTEVTTVITTTEFTTEVTTTEFTTEITTNVITEATTETVTEPTTEPTNDVIEISAIGGKAYLNPSTGIITGCDSTVTEITIPEEIDGVKIEGIAPDAFANCTELKVVKCAKGSPADDAKLYPETAQIVYTDSAEFVFGDADGDTIVTASDAAMVLQKTLVSTFELPMEKETDNWMKYVDVDADTYITASDAAFILQKTLVSTFELPAEKK